MRAGTEPPAIFTVEAGTAGGEPAARRVAGSLNGLPVQSREGADLDSAEEVPPGTAVTPAYIEPRDRAYLTEVLAGDRG